MDGLVGSVFIILFEANLEKGSFDSSGCVRSCVLWRLTIFTPIGSMVCCWEVQRRSRPYKAPFSCMLFVIVDGPGA